MIKLIKPNIPKLKSEGYSLVDMHVHTNASEDCSVSVYSILKKAKAMGIGVAITDHDRIDSAIAALNNDLGVLVIPGIEVYAKNDRHVLFYFYEKSELIRFYKNEVENKFLSKDYKQLLTLKDNYKCVAGMAHPKGFKIWQNFKLHSSLKTADFLEVLNVNCSKRKALKTYEWSLKHKKGITGGSDAHKLDDLGKGLTCSKGKTRKAVLNSIKKKKTFVIGPPLPFKGFLKKAPRHTAHLILWILGQIYYYTGVKGLVKNFKDDKPKFTPSKTKKKHKHKKLFSKFLQEY